MTTYYLPFPFETSLRHAAGEGENAAPTNVFCGDNRSVSAGSRDQAVVVCVVAHPDDETILCGGTLARLAAMGMAVHLLCLTRGEGGETGEPPLCERAELGMAREREMRCAAEKLGVGSVEFLGYVDPPAGPDNMLSAPPVDLTILARHIAAAIRRLAPQAVITHGSNGEYGHPAHRLTHLAVKQAVVGLGAAAPALYSFCACYPGHPYPRLANADDPADIIVEVTDFLDAKEAAALCHATQQALFVRRRSKLAGRTLSVREVLLTEESFRRHWPNGQREEAPIPGPLEKWLRTSGTAATKEH